jgi:hypothetical protein
LLKQATKQTMLVCARDSQKYVFFGAKFHYRRLQRHAYPLLRTMLAGHAMA